MNAAVRELTIHGQTVSYRSAGAGPVLVMLHGMAASSATWEEVIPHLAEHFTVIAPDLLGHGASAKPTGDYSLGEYATGIRDLLVLLGHRHGTILGHSLGGGVAMQFAYQFPEMCDRLVLVSSGGLGRELHPLLRLAALPGAEWVLPWLCSPGLRDVVDGAGRLLGRVGLRSGTDLREMWRGYVTLFEADARDAFIHTVRTVVDIGGQRATALNRLYLASQLPTLIVWGDRDPLIPVKHAYAAHEAIHGSRLEVFSSAGHFPYLDSTARFVSTLIDFIRSTQPAKLDAFLLSETVLKHSAAAPHL
jgi:pimeloyl-ACP methyl ester carboxylesterase